MLKLKLQTKFFLAYLVLSLLVIGSFGVIFYHYTSKILIEREMKSIVNLNEGFFSQTDDIIKDMDNVSINISYSNLVQKKLYENVDIKPGTDEFKNLAELFVAINGADVTADQMNLYDFSGNILHIGSKNNTSFVEFESLEWVDKVMENSGRKTISEPYLLSDFTVNSSPETSSWYISLYRTFQNEYKKEIGVIEIVKKCNSIFKHIISYQKKTKDAADIYIYDPEGILIYPYDFEKEEQWEVPDYFSARDFSASNKNYRNPEKDINEIMAYQTSSYTGWTYITVLPKSYVLKPVKEMLKLLCVIILVMILLCAHISYHFSKRLTKPIKQLSKIIQKTALENLGQKEHSPFHTSVDELEELHKEFSNMSGKLKTSMDDLIEAKQQELKSRNLALQSQINPHFYYNTLASIIALAESNQSQQVVTMCRNLTKMMRYITDSSLSNVKLEEEIDYIRQYLYCMKVRYQSSLSYEIIIEEEMKNEVVPKLVIQPLVENALKYTTKCAPPWHLSIKGIVSKEEWNIHIIDSGEGFSKESIERIQERMQETANTEGMPDIQINGMGILNVYLRWKYFCQEDIIFTYGNTREGHGIVTIGRKIKKEERCDLENG